MIGKAGPAPLTLRILGRASSSRGKWWIEVGRQVEEVEK
jgi:hypothetical protein